MVDWRTARAGQGAQQDSAGGGGAQSHLLLPHLVSHGDELLPQAQSRLVLLSGGRGRGGALDGDSVLSGLVTVHVDMSLQVELGREALPAAAAVVEVLHVVGIYAVGADDGVVGRVGGSVGSGGVQEPLS